LSERQPEEIADAIAILAMACRLPGAANPDELWSNLAAGKESITFFSGDEMVAAGVPPAMAHHPAYVGAKGVLASPDLFDGELFGFTPRDAERTDPQHRILLECAWEALETAGYGGEVQAGPVGVFVGSEVSGYGATHPSDIEQILGAGSSFLATRISYKLNLRGPSYAVQTACSTSLVAVHLAVKSLLDGECDMALAGGVSLRLPQDSGYLYQEGGIYSPDGHCRAFDVDGRGTVAGNGAGIVLLKRLDDALEDGDPVHCVILASAVNNDGSAKIGFTAPSVEGQARCIAEAVALARIEPASIGYIEAHGTGTPLGDPIEVAALNQAFGLGPASRDTCALGTLKASLGHLGAAAGVAGLIKAALAVERGQIPPTVHFRSPNPAIDFAGGPFFVNHRLMPWPRRETPRRAGVSSFGIGGTNAHVILEEAPRATPPALAEAPAARDPWQLLPVSARSAAALDQAAARLAAYLATYPDVDLADVAHTLQTGRRSFEQRRFVVATGPSEAAAALAGPPHGKPSARSSGGTPAVAFLFPGQGALVAGLGRQLYATERVFRDEIDRASQTLRAAYGFDPRPTLFAGGETTGRHRESERALAGGKGPGTRGGQGPADRLSAETAFAQAVLFVFEHALARLWMALGIEPAALLGHSAGEYAAACIAGVFSYDDALRLVAERGALMQRLPRGAMLAMALTEEEALPLVGPDLSLAAVNAPNRVVISGREEAIAALAVRLRGRGVPCRRLEALHAFHSADVEPLASSFAALVRTVPRRPPRIPLLSNVTGTWMTVAEGLDPEHWARHMRQPVRFAAGVETLAQDPDRVWLEVGPGETLSAFVRQSLLPAGRRERIVASLPGDGGAEQASLFRAVGHLWSCGARIDWRALHGAKRRRVRLPHYPFQRRSFWLPRDAVQQAVASHEEHLIARQLSLLSRQLDVLERRDLGGGNGDEAGLERSAP
jgi:phthiocerol/phenolphthiocerol synthesis type-I polyketide synthase E